MFLVLHTSWFCRYVLEPYPQYLCECHSPSLLDSLPTLGNLYSLFGPSPNGDIVQTQALSPNLDLNPNLLLSKILAREFWTFQHAEIAVPHSGYCWGLSFICTKNTSKKETRVNSSERDLPKREWLWQLDNNIHGRCKTWKSLQVWYRGSLDRFTFSRIWASLQLTAGQLAEPSLL